MAIDTVNPRQPDRDQVDRDGRCAPPQAVSPQVAADRSARTVVRLLFVVVAMFGFGYLMVPIYDILCDITGLNGKTGVADVASLDPAAADERRITVEFIASRNNTAPWDFRPETLRMVVSPGVSYSTAYLADNLTQRETISQAVPSVSPREASKYFDKIECFCFTEQVFAAGESKRMPLIFIIDPEIPASVTTVTLAYTIFDATGKVQQAGPSGEADEANS